MAAHVHIDLPEQRLGDQVYETRTARHLTQQQAADQIGVTQATLSRWETGQQGIHPLRVGMVREWIETTTRRER